MRRWKRWAVFMMCISVLLSLFGCEKRDKHILDGPGMVYEPKLDGFSLSRTSTIARDRFDFEYKADPFGDRTLICHFTTKGMDYIEVEDPPLTVTEELHKEILALELEKLPNVVPPEGVEEMEPVLDDGTTELTVTYTSGATVKKTVTGELVQKLFDILANYVIERSS